MKSVLKISLIAKRKICDIRGLCIVGESSCQIDCIQGNLKTEPETAGNGQNIKNVCQN